MIGITITPNVTPAVYDALAMCLDAAIECAKSATRVMVTLDDPEQQAACAQAVGILETMQRILQRQGLQDPGPQVGYKPTIDQQRRNKWQNSRPK